MPLTRELPLNPEDGWVDIAAAVTPALIPEAYYKMTFQEQVNVLARLDYASEPPGQAVASGHPVVAGHIGYVFIIPDPDYAKVWVRCVDEGAAVIAISPIDPEGDGSEP